MIHPLHYLIFIQKKKKKKTNDITYTQKRSQTFTKILCANTFRQFRENLIEKSAVRSNFEIAHNLDYLDYIWGTIRTDN